MRLSRLFHWSANSTPLGSRLPQLLGQPAADVLVVVGVGVGHRRHLHQLGAEQAQGVLLLLALGVGDDDERAVAARVGDQREPDAGVAGGGLHHQAAGLELAALLRLQDHVQAGAVLHRLAGVHELGLAQDGAAGLLGGAPELDEGRVADCSNHAVGDSHRENPPLEPQDSLNLDQGACGRQ